MSSKADDEFVFDSSAFINGARHHYFLDSMPGVWNLVEEEIENGGVIVIPPFPHVPGAVFVPHARGRGGSGLAGVGAGGHCE